MAVESKGSSWSQSRAKLRWSDGLPQLRERQKQVNAAKWELEALLADRHLELADEKTVRRFVEDLRALLGQSPLMERRAFIRSFVKEVKVTCDQAVVILHNADASEGIDCGGGAGSPYRSIWWAV